LLRSLVPLYRALGIRADWLVISGGPEFFEITKAFHNALQGSSVDLTEEAKQTYLSHSKRLAASLQDGYDYVIVHDPQPAAIRTLHGPNRARWVWRCHIDTSSPDQTVLDFLTPFLLDYDTRVFTMEQFVPAGLQSAPVAIIPPGIDPLSPKNMTAPMDLFHQILEWSGVRLDKLLITQVSRFDLWKDPMGVIRVYRQVVETAWRSSPCWARWR
jgi:trehalose synthase